jgi:hypothetical protein
MAWATSPPFHSASERTTAKRSDVRNGKKEGLPVAVAVGTPIGLLPVACGSTRGFKSQGKCLEVTVKVTVKVMGPIFTALAPRTQWHPSIWSLTHFGTLLLRKTLKESRSREMSSVVLRGCVLCN